MSLGNSMRGANITCHHYRNKAEPNKIVSEILKIALDSEEENIQHKRQ
jgi:hypothetical protein